MIATQNLNAVLRVMQWGVIALIFLFFLRVIRAVWVEMSPATIRKSRSERRRSVRRTFRAGLLRGKKLFLRVVEPEEYKDQASKAIEDRVPAISGGHPTVSQWCSLLWTDYVFTVGGPTDGDLVLYFEGLVLVLLRLDHAQEQLLAPGRRPLGTFGVALLRRSLRVLRMVAGLISTHTARMTRRKNRKISAMTPHCMSRRTAFRFWVANMSAVEPRWFTSSQK